MNRRQLLQSAGAAALAAPALRAQPARRPNVLFVLVDQWRASALGYAGDPNVQTPRLDRLAGQSVHFANAVSVCPVCTPYRAALMTGRYPTSTGMFLNDAYLPDGEVCLAETLAAGGYDTAYIGKWHLDGHGRDSYIPPARRQGWATWFGAECDHNYPHSHYYTDDSPEKRFWDGYDAFDQTRAATDFVCSRQPDSKPFCLFLSYGAPHFPHATAPAEYRKLYSPNDLKLAPNVAPEHAEAARRELVGYYGHCSALDKCVGDLLEMLDQSGLASNTIVVFTSDHGEMMGAHGVSPTQKQWPYDEAAHVPFLLRVPGVAPRVVDTPINAPDVLPTLLGLVGLDVPRTVEGENLAPVVRGTGPGPDRDALVMSVSPFTARLPEYRMIRSRQYTYARRLDGPWLLFDNLADPYQQRNLVDQKALCDELDGRLQAALRRIGDRFEPREAYLKRFGYTLAPHGSVSYAQGAPVQSPRRAP
ncbi:MAG: sulfatase [Armatimonadetes bacterium]|nr:sulfatase [Armatimonadota bacterium]